jgi:hypothetical protein
MLFGIPNQTKRSTQQPDSDSVYEINTKSESMLEVNK